jgi:hypothetical protein
VPQNFLPCDRDQEPLLPPSLREWLPENHLALFVLDAVEEIDLSAFCSAYREEGLGPAAFERAMMVALLLYAYAVGERSSRGMPRLRLRFGSVRPASGRLSRVTCTRPEHENGRLHGRRGDVGRGEAHRCRSVEGYGRVRRPAAVPVKNQAANGVQRCERGTARCSDRR